MSYQLIQASAHAIPLEAETVQTCVTSPPYWGLREYAGEQEIAGWDCALGLEPTPELYVEHMVEVFREVRRVLRPDGTLWLNLGDSYAGGASGSNPSPSSGLGSGPNGASKHRDSVTFAVRPAVRGIKPKDLVGIPWRVAFALQADGWYLRSDIIWSKSNPMPESVTDRPTKAHEYIFLLSKRARYYFGADAVREEWQQASIDRQRSPLRAQSPEDGFVASSALNREAPYEVKAGRNIRTVWNIATQPYAGAHFATFPEAIPERCIKAGSAPGDLVLDPFNGTGTTGRVAQRLGRDYVGLDTSSEYLEMALERVDPIAAVAKQTGGQQAMPI